MDVFSVQCLVDSLPLKIDAFAANESRLLVSTADGSVLLYGIQETPVFGIQLIESRKGFAKKPVSQLELVPELDLFLCLSDGNVTIHQLGTFATVGQVPVKPVVYLSLEPTAVHSPSPTENRSHAPQRQFAVVNRRIMSMYNLNLGGGLKKIKDVTLNDRPRTMRWLSTDRIAYATTRGYYAVDLTTGQSIELLSISSLLGTFTDIANFSSGPKLTITPLPEGRLMVSKGHMGVFVNSDGSALIERDLEWSAIPEEVYFSAPYVVALMPQYIEIRSLNTGGTVQTIHLPDCRTMIMGGQLIHASNASGFIWRLLPFDFEDQIEHLISSNKFQEAQRLIEELEFSTDDDKLANIIRVRGLFAHHLFTNEHKYEEAISLLGELKASPVDVINLYPQFSLLGSNGDPPVTDSVALKSLMSYLTSQRSVLARLRDLQATQTQSPPRANRSILSVSNITSSVSTATSTHGGGSAISASALSVDGNDAVTTSDDTMFLSEVVDTVLLKLYLIMSPALVGALLRIQNFCNVDECEAALIAKGRQNDLVDLYYGKGLHRRGLEGLTKELKNGNVNVRTVVKYLLKLDMQTHLDMIIEFAEPVIERDLEAGLQIFVQRYDELPQKSYQRILDFLERLSPVLERGYLEHIFDELLDRSPELHDRLVFNYLRAIMLHLAKSSDGLDVGTGSDDEAVLSVARPDSVRSKLRKFLEESTYYRAERILALFPEDALLEERATLLSRVGRHQEALEIYVDRLHNFELAQSYCDRHYSPSDAAAADIYYHLLVLFLGAQGRGEMTMEQVLQFLDRSGRHVNGPKALSILPGTTVLSRLLTFAGKSLTELQRMRHEEEFVLGLSRAERLQVRGRLGEGQKRKVFVGEDRMCSRCLKRIGNSVFATYPSGMIVHVFCQT
ncbi:CNH domain-containing protein [Zopfochytrium polystomum]|nr:CNH domain-containing protein [Zopfochytrium polystomum]